MSVQVIYWEVFPGETGKDAGEAGHSRAEAKPGTRLRSSPGEGLADFCREIVEWKPHLRVVLP